ncbi:MAG: Smr/MutS family protein [Kofleriaceae bacterium]|nr:Smr/MutS family protein [Kofleriaceae bacterium]
MGRSQKQPRPHRPAVSPEEQQLFLEAIGDAVPLPGRDRDRVRITPPPPRPVATPTLPSPVSLTIDGHGDAVSARAPGVNRAQVAELRGGRIRPEGTLDLHGRTAAAAVGDLRRFLGDAATHRRRCVLIVHGRGLHSDGVAVLRDLVLAELVGPLSGYVHAFATAAPGDGGTGATYVMVRG